MINSLIETLELQNFGHMTTSTIQFESRDTVLLVTSLTEIMTSKPFFKILYFAKGWGSYFC